MRETWVQSLGWEDPLEKGKATQLQYSGLENSMDYMYTQRGHKEQLSLSLSVNTSPEMGGGRGKTGIWD